MRKVVLSLLFIALVFTSNAQNELKNEVGFSLSGFNSFGLSAKFESEPNRLWRLGALTFIGNADKTSRDSVALNRRNFRMEFGFGREIRKPITDEFFIYFGVDAIVGFTSTRNEVSIQNEFDLAKDRSIRGGIGIPVGFSYILKDQVNFSIEFVPSFGYQYRNISSSNSDTKKVAHIVTNSFWSTVNTESLKITIAYRFEKRKNRMDK